MLHATQEEVVLITHMHFYDIYVFYFILLRSTPETDRCVRVLLLRSIQVLKFFIGTHTFISIAYNIKRHSHDKHSHICASTFLIKRVFDGLFGHIQKTPHQEHRSAIKHINIYLPAV